MTEIYLVNNAPTAIIAALRGINGTAVHASDAVPSLGILRSAVRRGSSPIIIHGAGLDVDAIADWIDFAQAAGYSVKTINLEIKDIG